MTSLEGYDCVSGHLDTGSYLGFRRGAGDMERVTRIELALSAWEADVLPLNYTREPVQPSRILTNRPTATCPDMVPDPPATARRVPGRAASLPRRAPQLGPETVSCHRAAL